MMIIIKIKKEFSDAAFHTRGVLATTQAVDLMDCSRVGMYGKGRKEKKKKRNWKIIDICSLIYK